MQVFWSYGAQVSQQTVKDVLVFQGKWFSKDFHMTNDNTFKNASLNKVVRKLTHQIRKPVSCRKHTLTLSICIFSFYYITNNDILISPKGRGSGRRKEFSQPKSHI